MFPILQLGPLAIQTPGLILILGLWLGLSLAEKTAPHFNSNANTIYNLTFTVLVAGFLGARMIYALRYLDIFISAPINLISINPGLLDPAGGIAIGFLAGLIYGNRKNLPLYPSLDALTPMLAVFAIAIAGSNLASGNGFGLETDLPWGIWLWGAKRHPSQIYEILAGFIILGIVWPRKGKTNPVFSLAGGTFWFFLTSSAGARLFLEAFRGDSLLIGENIRLAQVIAWIVMAIGLGMIRKIRIAAQPKT